MSDPRVDLRPRGDREALLLIDCARATIDPATADRLQAHVAAGPDWNRLVGLAQRHGLAPLLYTHLSQVCPERVPPATLALLRDYCERNTAFVSLLTGELVRLLKILQAKGITAIPYKGPAIALKLYGGLARRQFADVDILVRRRDVWEAGRAIEAEGFEPVFPLPDAMRERVLRHGYVRMFHRGASRTLLELHWDIAEPHWAVRFDADSMWRRLEPLELPGTTALVPCVEDLLLLLCVHGVRHESDKLEGMSSIAELLRSTPDLDWDRVWRLSEEMHCRRILVFGLLLAQGLFEVPLPPRAAEAVRESRALQAMARATVRHLLADEPPARTWRRQIAFQLRLKDSRMDQARYGARILTSTPDDGETTRLPESLSFVYPLVRAVRLARK